MPQAAKSSSLALSEAITSAIDCLFRQQFKEGYWWFTLEANESIGAGFIQLMHFIGEVDQDIQAGILAHMLSEQREDGSWAVFYDGPGDLSVTIECYFALRFGGHSPEEPALQKARGFILKQGGLTKMRIFSRIHLALFGLVPWSVCPSMPIWFQLLTASFGISIYEFSSWARASIVPLLILGTLKPVHPVNFTLDELFTEEKSRRKFRVPKQKSFFSLGNFFIQFDRILKILEKLPFHPGKKAALRAAETWTREHIARTEDIYPAMGYAALAFNALGYDLTDPTLSKAFSGLKRFQQSLQAPLLPDRAVPHYLHSVEEIMSPFVHQQCCISPNWDSPWTGVALLTAGVSPHDERLLQAGRYLLKKEIKDFRGDWKFKNPEGPAGGWSFEFENDYFPDVDDAVEAVFFLKKLALPETEKEPAIQRSLAWILSMQSDNGGWGAFDKNNTSEWVNKIPFSDHGACLDSPTVDLTARVIEMLIACGTSPDDRAITRALDFIRRRQEPNGSWRGRWGVNYIYGTWCVLQGLAAVREENSSARIQKSISWLQSIQNPDGGWGESCLSDTEGRYVPLGVSVPSQTAWAVLGLIAAGEEKSKTVLRGVQWLTENQNNEGGWDEKYFTGTGFPGHFYINYHGYRYYFPLLALGIFARKTA